MIFDARVWWYCEKVRYVSLIYDPVGIRCNLLLVLDTSRLQKPCSKPLILFADCKTLLFSCNHKRVLCNAFFIRNANAYKQKWNRGLHRFDRISDDVYVLF